MNKVRDQEPRIREFFEQIKVLDEIENLSKEKSRFFYMKKVYGILRREFDLDFAEYMLDKELNNYMDMWFGHQWGWETRLAYMCHFAYEGEEKRKEKVLKKLGLRE